MENQTNQLISIDHVTVEWERGRKVLDNVSLHVNRGDFVAITGPNGGGKTTLLRIILKLLKPTRGSVIYLDNGMVTDRLSIGYLPQKNMIDSKFPITVDDVIASGLSTVKGLSRDERKLKVDEIIELTGLREHAGKAIGNLSGGQLQRTLLGRAIISRPSVLVLDEPLSYVDKRFEQRIYEIVADLSKTTTIILVSHEMSTIAGMANRHLIVDHTITECTAAHHHVHYDCDEARPCS